MFLFAKKPNKTLNQTLQNKAQQGVQMKTNAELTSEFIDMLNDADGDVAGRLKVAKYMAQSSAIVHNEHIKSSVVPRFFNNKSYLAMKNCAERAHKILCKVMQHYLEDPSYRNIFSFDPRLEDLILIPRRYKAMLPFARVDTFMDENRCTFKFCEFNADGSAGMNENREVTVAVAQSDTYRKFAQKYRLESCELFNAWVDEFLSIYETFENRVTHPRFAICDYLDHGVVDEFKIFASVFNRRGYPCKIVDVRDVSFRDGVLRDKDGEEINAIWRRCVTNDVLEFWNESQDLIEAVREGAVALIGSFAGHIVHDKQINKALFHPKTHEFLTEDEIAFVKETVPYTAFLDDGEVDLEDIKANKDNWIIKPTDAYGGDDVYAGRQLGQSEWEQVINKFANGSAGAPFIVQTFISPFKSEVVPYETVEEIEELIKKGTEISKNVTIQKYNNLNGLYLFNGHFGGVFSRLGPRHIITKPMGAITCATIWVHDEEETPKSRGLAINVKVK